MKDLVFYANSTTIVENFSKEQIRDSLTTEDLHRADRFVREVDRNNFLAARLGLIGLLTDLGIDLPKPFSVQYGINGKPFLEKIPIQFNWSHSGGLVCWILSSSNCGVDVELHTTYQFETPESIFTKQELNWMRDKEETMQSRFFTLWTVKESIIKFLGTGLSLDPRLIHLNSVDQNPRTWVVQLREPHSLHIGAEWLDKRVIICTHEFKEGKDSFALSWCLPYDLKESISSSPMKLQEKRVFQTLSPKTLTNSSPIILKN